MPQLNGWKLQKKEAPHIVQLEDFYLDIYDNETGAWYSTRGAVFKITGRILLGGELSQWKKGMLKLYIHYKDNHPNGLTMGHKSWGNGDYFRIVKVGTDE